MQLRPRQVTPPDEKPVSLEQVKEHLRVDHDDDDALIGTYIEAATSLFDGHSGILGRCIVTQTWRQDLAGWPAGRVIRLPLCDVDPESVGITYRDAQDAEQTVDASAIEVLEDALGAAVVLRPTFSPPSLSASRSAPVSIEFDAGYGAPDKVPAAIKHAILLTVADFYELRENTVVGQLTVSQIPMGAMFLIEPHRRSAV